MKSNELIEWIEENKFDYLSKRSDMLERNIVKTYFKKVGIEILINDIYEDIKNSKLLWYQGEPYRDAFKIFARVSERLDEDWRRYIETIEFDNCQNYRDCWQVFWEHEL